MKLRNIFIIIVLLLFAFANAQNNPDKVILDKYTNINIDFFTTDNYEYSQQPLYKAFKASIEGDRKTYLEHLEKSLNNTKDEDVKKQISDFLYFAYLDQKKREKADELDRKSESINYDLYSNIVAKKTDYPATKLATSVNQTEVKFDQFYFDAVVAKNDTVRVFFDTCAPGVSISQELVEKYDWETDTTYQGQSVLPAFNTSFKNYPVLLPNLKIGDFNLKNLPAKYNIISEEQQAKSKSSGIEDHDILIGLNVFENLLDGVEFDFENNRLRLIKKLPKKNVKPNFMMADAKPAIKFKLSGKRHTAFLDTGSPRHVLPDELITDNNSYFKEKGNYGDFQYDIFYVKYDQVLNQDDIWLDTADYGGFEVSEFFKIDALFGSFLGRTLAFDFRNRRASLR